MAVYVTSDIHGHLCALQEALAAAGVSAESLAAGDTLYVLGDMIDRGPDPIGVIDLVRSLPNTHVLMGNHEQLMLAALEHVAPPEGGHFDISGMDTVAFTDWIGWTNNGGGTTIEQLQTFELAEYTELLSWMRELSFYEVVHVGDGDERRPYILVHAGIDVLRANAWRYANPEANLADAFALESLLADQQLEDLVWIREEFWNRHTGFVGEDGLGPVVIAGHTPSLTLGLCLDESLGATAQLKTPEDKGLVVPLGADETTGGVADRIDIDASAAAGYPYGRVAVMRLDDGAVFYGDVREGE